MKRTEQTLLEQMRITELDVERRKALLSFTAKDVAALYSCKTLIEQKIDELVAEFYRLQTSVTEIALLIGDADTLGRLRNAQRRYVLDLFSGIYDLEYVNNRLRIGLVHKRIGVEPKLYLSAVQTLSALLQKVINESFHVESERDGVLTALSKLVSFDVTLVFETYIRSLVSEIETAKDKSEQYARSMEEKVKERTQQLEDMSRTDPLTGLQNVRHMEEITTRILRSAQRRAEPVSALYLDVDDFKRINDTEGHQRGDEVLRGIGKAIKEIARIEDACFRYGGDEFCVILCNCPKERAENEFVARLREKLGKSLQNISVSIGVAQTGPNEYLDANILIRKADEEMYIVKQILKARQNVAKVKAPKAARTSKAKG